MLGFGLLLEDGYLVFIHTSLLLPTAAMYLVYGFHFQKIYGKCWLPLQSPLIPSGLQSILIVKEENSDSFTPMARWPESDQRDQEKLADMSERALSQQCGLLAELPDEPDGDAPGPKETERWHWTIAYPTMALKGCVHKNRRFGLALEYSIFTYR